MLGKIVVEGDDDSKIAFVDPNKVRARRVFGFWRRGARAHCRAHARCPAHAHRLFALERTTSSRPCPSRRPASLTKRAPSRLSLWTSASRTTRFAASPSVARPSRCVALASERKAGVLTASALAKQPRHACSPLSLPSPSWQLVPYDYDFSTEEYDGLFLSNGPGDPAVRRPACLQRGGDAACRPAATRPHAPLPSCPAPDV